MNHKKLLFVYNPVSGKGLIRSKLPYIIEKLSELGTVTVIPTKGKGDATRSAAELMADFDMVVCSGGDGTLNEITTGYMSVPKEDRKPCAYIPAGTVNDFATSLGISKNIIKCVDGIAHSRVFPYDIGEFNERYFNYVAGFGAFTEVSYSTPQNFKNLFGKAAYIMEGVRQIPKIKSLHVRITTPEKVVEDDFVYGMICNTFSVGGLLKIDEDSVELDDGKFEAIMIKTPTNAVDFQETVNDLILSKTDSRRLVYLRSNDFIIESKSSLPWTLDGEFGGKTKKAHIINHERAIDFLKP